MNPKITKKAGIILLAVIIVVQLVFTIFTFAFKKEGVHSDEPWSYGLANSNYKPFVYLKEGVNIDEAKENDYDNLNKWISSDVLHDYITVQKGERFNYKSVYDNQKYDHHPPLYYMVLHTICSFFPDKFSYWYGFFINCIALVFTQIYLYKLGMLITKGKPYMALLICLLYGGGVGAMSTFTFVRMYAMVTALSTAHIYYQFRLYYSEDFNIKKNILPIIITGILGALTENMFIIIMGLCTACLCIWLLCKKKIKKMFIFGFTMLGTLGVALAIFPFPLLQTSGWKEKYSVMLSFSDSFESYLGYTTLQNLGFKIRFDIFPSWLSLIFILLFSVIVIISPVCFLFRNKPFVVRIKNKAVKLFDFVKKNISTVNFPFVFLVAISSCYTAVISKLSDTSRMGDFACRYVTPLYPLICIITLIILQFIIKHIRFINKYIPYCVATITVAVIAIVNIRADNPFLCIQPKDSVNLSELTKNKKCQVVISAPWYSTVFQDSLMNCSEVKFSLPEDFYDFKNQSVDFDGIEENQTMYLAIVKGTNVADDELKENLSGKGYPTEIPEDTVLKSIKNSPNVKSLKQEGTNKINGRLISVYKIN